MTDKKDLTEASKLFNDGSKRAVGDALELAEDSIRQSASGQVPRFDTPLYQRHDISLHGQVNK